jgi:hypothetical protein
MTMLDELKQTKTILLIIVAIIAIVAAGVAWWKDQHPSVVSKTQFVEIPQIKTVEKIKTVMVPMKEVETIVKADVSKKLNLADGITQDENKQVTCSGVVPAYEGKTDIVSVIDTKTGKSEIVAKEEALPWFEFESKKEIGARAGYGIKNSQEVDIYGRWDFLRIGKVHVGVYGEGNTAGDAKAMLNVGYKW